MFGEDTTLTAKTMIYVKGSGTWDKAFDTITGSFKKINAYLDKEGLKPAGLPMTIFTATDDTGFDFEAAVPIADAPKNPPHGDPSCWAVVIHPLETELATKTGDPVVVGARHDRHSVCFWLGA